MIKREFILNYASSLSKAGYDFPFEGDFNSAVLRHTDTKKWFGVLISASENYFTRYKAKIPENREVLCLKCPQDLQPFLFENIVGVLPAYHMNKNHWISIVLSSEISEDDTKKLINLSYEITGNKK